MHWFGMEREYLDYHSSIIPNTFREEKEPLNQPVSKSVSVEFDGRQVYTKSGEIIGKHSAV